MAIFVIVAVLIVAVIVLVVVFRGELFGADLGEFGQVFDAYGSCIEGAGRNAVEIAGVQGGHIDTGDYVPGSEYAPFSSHLTFLGTPIKYWYYVSGNNVIRENVPSKNDIENEISEVVAGEIADCDFSSFYEQGFYVDAESEPDVKTTINGESVKVSVNAALSVSREGKSARKTSHGVEISSRLGKFYDSALEIYEKEKNEAFLENYAVDALRSYAPVDGALLQCGPEIWNTQEVVTDLMQGIEANYQHIKFKGDYYTLDNKEDSYFVVDKSVEFPTRVVYSREWPSKVEITPADNAVMIAKPIGNEQGLGVMGFCYVPYHFVYDVSFPALIQIYDGNELFQFPVAVVIDNNVAREARFSELGIGEQEFDICSSRPADIKVNVYDLSLNPVSGARVSYKCFDDSCFLGKTGANGGLEASAPQCLNGQVIAEIEGYKTGKALFSTNKENIADIVLDKEHENQIEVRIGSKALSGTAIVQFESADEVRAVALPQSDKVSLSEGLYNVSVYVYGKSAIVIPSSSKTQCQQVPRVGILGFLGQTKEECFEIKFPETRIEHALTGGGKAQEYLLESDLKKGKMIISVQEFAKPTALEQLQYNFESMKNSRAEVSFL